MGKHKKKETRNPVWERRKNAIVRNYGKIAVKEKQKDPCTQMNYKNFTRGSTKTFMNQAMKEYQRKKAEKDRIIQIVKAKRKEREEKFKKYIEKKRENFKKISKKTKWGQPVMSGRMEILLEKIQKSYTSDSIK